MPVDIDALTSDALLAAFGEPIVYRPRDQAELPPGLRGIFDRAQVQVLLGDADAPSSVPKTWIGVRQADFPPGFKHRQLDRLVVRRLTFDVVAPYPDGQGWVFLELGKVG